MKERRSEQRHPIAAEMKISHPDVGDIIVKTKNLSDSGLFVVAGSQQMPPVGTLVNCQVQREGEDMPVVPMKIVRTTEGGLGLLLVDSGIE